MPIGCVQTSTSCKVGICFHSHGQRRQAEVSKDIHRARNWREGTKQGGSKFRTQVGQTVNPRQTASPIPWKTRTDVCRRGDLAGLTIPSSELAPRDSTFHSRRTSGECRVSQFDLCRLMKRPDACCHEPGELLVNEYPLQKTLNVSLLYLLCVVEWERLLTRLSRRLHVSN